MARGPVSTGPLGPGSQRLLDAEVARSSRRGPATAQSVRGRRAAARKAKAAAEAQLEALRSGVKAPRKPRAKGGTRTKTSYPLTQRGLAAAARAGTSKSTRKAARTRALTQFKIDQLESQRRRLAAGEAALTKEEIKARRKLLPTAAQARAELRAAEARARGRAFTSADVVRQEVRNLQKETAETRDSIAKLKITKKYGDSPEAKQMIAAIEARAAERAKKAAKAAAKRAGIVESFTKLENFTYVPKARKPSTKPRKRTFVPKSERTKAENARKAKLSRLQAQLDRLKGTL